MMNNQTIDGLPRELLDLCYRALNGGDNQLTGMEHGRAFRELRALLDAPETKNWEYFHNAMESERDYWKALAQQSAAKPQGDIETLRAALRTEVEAGDSWKREALALREKLEAQPQGEPDAYSYKVRVHATGIGMVWRDKIEREAPDTEAVEVKDLTPLYAEQP